MHQPHAEKPQMQSKSQSPKNKTTPVRITRIPQKQNMNIFQKLLQKIFKLDNPEETVQDTMPFRTIYKDGICKIDDSRWSKTVAFDDITFSLAEADAQEEILLEYCKFLCYFDASVRVQLTLQNKFANVKELERNIYIPDKKDHVQETRDEYRTMLKKQMTVGTSGLLRVKYITFSVEAKTLADARIRLERMATDIVSNFKRMNVKARPLDGQERMQVLFGQMHPDGRERFTYKWSDSAITGLPVKDVIAPTSMEFGEKRKYHMGNDHCAAYYMQINASEISEDVLADIMKMNNALTITLHITPVDQIKAIKTVKRKLTDIESQKIDEQKKAAMSGYDADIIPSDLKTFGTDIEKTLKDLQGRNMRMFMCTFTVVFAEKTKKALEVTIQAANQQAQKHNCELKPLDWQQEQAFGSMLALGNNLIEVERMLLTHSLGILVPFSTAELFLAGDSLYYGLNALSNNMIMGNRKTLNNPNGLILGTPGSGKSFAAKREIVNAFLITDDDVIIVDPEGEYSNLVENLGGQVIKLSNGSPHCVNPFDLDIENDDGEGGDPVELKSDFVISMMQMIVAGRNTLTPREVSIIDRCVQNLYREFRKDPAPENTPILEDFLTELRQQKEEEADNMAVALELYVTGSQGLFNKRTNVDVKNRLVCYNIKELGSTLKNMAMLILQDAVWGRVSANRSKGKKTWYYVDEFHLLLRDELTAGYSVAIWKRFRKWGGIPTGITQNIKDFLSSPEVSNIFENTDFILMLKQAPGDKVYLAKALGISESQLSYVTNSPPGQGLIFHGDIIIPFIDRFPTDTNLFKLMTTRLEDVVQSKETKPVKQREENIVEVEAPIEEVVEERHEEADIISNG